MIGVALPKPIAGLIIATFGTASILKAATKARRSAPARLWPRFASTKTATTRVLVLPITHAPPDHPALAVEIPAKVKNRLQLDDARSWVVLSEWNEFVWPGPDLRRLPGATDASIAYGMLPPGLFAMIRDRFLAIVNSGSAQRVPRS